MIKITIPLNPVTKKNQQQIFKNSRTGKPFITQSKRYKEYEKNCLELLKWLYRGKTIDYPVNIKAIYYRKTKHTVDISNLHSAMNDVLVKAKVIEDDSYKIVVGLDGSRVRFDRDNPRTEIEITRVDGD